MNQADRLHYKWRRVVGQLGALLLAVIVLSFGACQERCSRNTGAPTLPLAPVHTGPAPSSYADVVSRVTPAVITIRSERRVRAPRQHPFLTPRSSVSFSANVSVAACRSRASAYNVAWDQACS